MDIKALYLLLLLFLWTGIWSPVAYGQSVSNVGQSTYDYQTDYSTQRRIVNHGDGTYSAVWTQSFSYESTAPDRGTGYNYYNGSTWGPIPTQRIEGLRSGWPSIGNTGTREYFVSHTNSSGLNFAWRAGKGSGSWSVTHIPNDQQAVFSNTANINDTIFVIASRQAPNTFNGVEGGLALHRTFNGGNTWVGPTVINGLDAANFSRIRADEYAIDANPVSKVVAIVTGWPRVTLFKSVDFGNTWQRTFLFNVSNPLYTGNAGELIDSTVTSDASYSILVDDNGTAHVFYGRKIISDNNPAAGYTSYPFDAGIMYWNENMGTQKPILISNTRIRSEQAGQCEPVFSTNPNVASGYLTSIVSMPSAGVDSNGHIYLAYTALRSTIFDAQQNPINYHSSGLMYRDIYLIKSTDGGQTWTGPLNVSDAPTAEAVYPSLPRIVGDSVYVVYMWDTFPGIAVQQTHPNGGGPFLVNSIRVAKVGKNSIVDPISNCIPEIFTTYDGTNVPTSFINCPLDTSVIWATDLTEGDISSNIQSFGAGINVSQLGVQSGQYYALNSSGLSSDTITVMVNIVTDPTPPVITLIGSSSVNISIGTSYTDAGYTVTDNSSCTINVVVTGNVDVNTPGTYTLTFTATDGSGNTTVVTRTINVGSQDTTDPVITLNGNNPLIHEACQIFTDPGANAIDNVDGNITINIQVTNNVNVNVPGNYTITYTVSDASGNTAVATRTVIVEDNTPPDLNLPGASPHLVLLNTSYTEPGFSATDCVDGNLTSLVTSNAATAVDTSVRGTYIVTYSVSDLAGNTATQTRTVKVNTAPEADFTFTFSSTNPAQVDFLDNSDYDPASWLWNFGDGSATSTQQNPSHTFSGSGNFDVCLTVKNDFNTEFNLTESQTCKRVVLTSVGEIIDIRTVTLIPNPAVDVFEISWDNYIKNPEIKVMNMLGEIVYHAKVSSSPHLDKYRIDASTFANGVYLVRIDMDELSIHKKLVIQR